MVINQNKIRTRNFLFTIRFQRSNKESPSSSILSPIIVLVNLRKKCIQKKKGDDKISLSHLFKN